MNKFEFICRQLSKASKKTFEHYVVTRIWHLLNDTELKFVTQQHITRPNGRALTDMYFPQLHIHIEIDEKHHKNQISLDKAREADIINATGHTVLRVDIMKNVVIEGEKIVSFDVENLGIVNKTIDEIVAKIQLTKINTSNFKVWDFEAEQNPQTYITRGFIDLKDDVALRLTTDVASCFGGSYKPKGIWKGGIKHPKEASKGIWFPKLYKNKDWNNTISEDDTIITERPADSTKIQEHISNTKQNSHIKRIVFARVKSPLGDIMYRFRGEFELDLEQTNEKNGAVYKRINTQVKTYSSK